MADPRLNCWDCISKVGSCRVVQCMHDSKDGVHGLPCRHTRPRAAQAIEDHVCHRVPFPVGLPVSLTCNSPVSLNSRFEHIGIASVGNHMPSMVISKGISPEVLASPLDSPSTAGCSAPLKVSRKPLHMAETVLASGCPM